jgi:hypothetical protein
MLFHAYLLSLEIGRESDCKTRAIENASPLPLRPSRWGYSRPSTPQSVSALLIIFVRPLKNAHMRVELYEIPPGR